jgi:hypothetical protein
MSVAEAISTADADGVGVSSLEWEAAWAAFEAGWNAMRTHVKQYECHTIELPVIDSAMPITIAMPSQVSPRPAESFSRAPPALFIRDSPCKRSRAA